VAADLMLRLRSRRGFTLVELLVALVVSALVVSVAFRAVTVATDATARMREDRHGALRAGAARAQLDLWLRAATFLDGAEPFVGQRGAQRDGPPLDELTFAVADAGALRPGPRRVHLWIGRDSAGLRSGLLAELTALSGHDAIAAETLVVAPTAAGLRLRYRGRFAGREGWAGEWASSTLLPAAIELRLLPASGSTRAPLPPILEVPLTVPLGQADDPVRP
jgi:prepilin-type N-terminal cleavage/methylation domain-containing protein